LQVPAARLVFSDADRDEIAARVAGALTTGRLTLGENTAEFEATFADLHEMPFAVSCSSGTAALEIILRAVGVAGRDVVVPANTFAATAFAVLRAGARPVFADVDAHTFALSPKTVVDLLTPETAAVVIVHIGGLVPPDVIALRALCDERGVALIEDAAHAHGATLDGVHAGSFGVAGAFSFYPTKVITSAEGGMIVTADQRIRDEAVVYRDQGKAGFSSNLNVREGYAWRLSELQAAVGVVQLNRLEEFVAVRRRVASRYTDGLKGIEGLAPLPVPDGSLSNYYKYVALLEPGVDRAALKQRLRTEFDVALSGEVYDTPLHLQPVFADIPHGPLPVAEDVCARHVCLPIHSDMSDSEVDHVLASLAAVVGRQ
jgi:dTDP-4-amino-4,6-dideoxygalactose transaminase